jgi:hypothetical protein
MEGTSTEEGLLMREIEDHPVVNSLSFIRAIGRDKTGHRANLRCDCKQVGPVRMSSKRPTLQDCLRELGRLIQQDHGPTCVAAAQELQSTEKDAADASTKRPPDEAAVSINANDVLMLHRRLKIIQQRAAEANKVALEAEKERDELHNQIEQIEVRDHRQQATRVQNRRNVQLGSRQNQAKPRADTDGFLHHTCLGLLGGLHIGVWGTLLWQSISS